MPKKRVRLQSDGKCLAEPQVPIKISLWGKWFR